MLGDRLAALLAPRYTLGEELPGGGMARVFAARDGALDRDVVVKVLPPELATAVAAERFRREARLLARLAHPHVVPVLDSGESDGAFWFVMPRVSESSLRDALTAGPLDEAEVRRLGLELLDALEHAHDLGVIHRDIKPGNILLHTGHALLGDFGVAMWRDVEAETLTAEGHAVGTLAYMPPEQREGIADARSDCWALAACLYEAATGTPWSEASTRAEPWRGVPGRLATVLRRALAVRRDARWPDARAFRAALAGRARTRPGARWLAAGLALPLLSVLVVALRPGWDGAPTQPVTAYDVQVEAEPGDAIAGRTSRQAILMLQWLPRLRVRPDHADGRDAPGARFRVELGRRVRVGDTVLVLVGHRFDGSIVAQADVPLDGRDETAAGRRLAREIVARLFPERLSDFDLLDADTDDPEAWRALFAGFDAFQAGEWERADSAFGQVLRRDPDFLVGRWARLLTRMWRREPYEAELAQLVAARRGLPPLIAALVVAQQDEDLSRRLATFDSIASAHPDYAPARLLLANELFHRGPLVGHELREGMVAFLDAARDVSALDRANTHEQVLWGALRIGDRALAEASVRALARQPSASTRRQLLLYAFDARFVPLGATLRRALLDRVTTGETADTLVRYLRLAGLMDLPSEQERFARLAARRATGAETRRSATAALASALLMQGRPAAALAELDSLALDPGRGGPFALAAAEWRLLLPGFGWPRAVDPGRAEHEVERATSDPVRWPRAAATLALAQLAANDIGPAVRWGDSLARGASHDRLAALLAPLVAAQLAARRGALDSALALSAAIAIDPGDSLTLARGPLLRAVTKWSRASWWLASGDTSAAERELRWSENNDLQGWPVGPPQEGEVDAALSPLVRLRRAVLLCRTGRAADGRALLARVEELWRSAEGWPPDAKDWRALAGRDCA